MFGGYGRRGTVRRRVSRLEQALSAGILVALTGLGWGLYRAGQATDGGQQSVPGPMGLTALGTGSARTLADSAGLALPETTRLAALPAGGPSADTIAAPPLPRVLPVASAATPTPAQALPTAAAPGPGSTSAAVPPPTTTPAGPDAGPLAGLAVGGMQPTGPVERFGAANLYEKIDGRAEQYLAYDVQSLVCQPFGGPGGATVDVYAYDMGEPLRAFGVYAAERVPEAEPLGLGGGGYTAGGSCLFWQDRWYLQVLAGDPSDATRQACLGVARALSARLGKGGPSLWGLALLPANGRVANSEEFHERDAFGLDFLGNVFTARYRLSGGSELTAFVSRQASAAAAATVLAAYQTYLHDYGTAVVTGQVEGLPATSGTVSGTCDLVFRAGRFVAGVTLAADSAKAWSVGAAIARRLGEERP